MCLSEGMLLKSSRDGALMVYLLESRILKVMGGTKGQF